MQVTKHRHFYYLTPMDEAQNDDELEHIFRLKWPKAVSVLSNKANFFAEMVDECLQHEAWRVIGFDSFEAFCRDELDMTVKEVRGILEQVASDGGHDATQELSRAEETQRKREAVHDLRAEHPELTQQQIADEMGCSERWVRELTGSETDESSNSVPTTIKQECQATGRSMQYIQDKRRLAAGFPELLAKVEAGELSCNAAAIEAHIRKKPTPLQELKREWIKATAKEKTAFDEWRRLTRC
jgi:hypothetical protein